MTPTPPPPAAVEGLDTLIERLRGHSDLRDGFGDLYLPNYVSGDLMSAAEALRSLIAQVEADKAEKAALEARLRDKDREVIEWIEETDILDRALDKAADQFRFYAKQHRAKGTPEGDAKAKVNDDLAEEFKALISGRASPSLVVEADKARIAELEAGLKPFGDYFAALEQSRLYQAKAALFDDDAPFEEASETHGTPAITYGHLRKARALLPSPLEAGE